MTSILADVSPVGQGTGLPPSLQGNLKLNALGLSLHMDSRDNLLTPRNGTNARGAIKRFDHRIGSDVSFTSGELFAAHFWSPDNAWTFSGMALYNTASGDTPFFMAPSIAIRGVPYNRYQGSDVFSTEIEVRRQFSPRWTGLGFLGYGAARSGGVPGISTHVNTAAAGVGVRYRIAKSFGLDVGLDIAVSEEDTAIYIQFGHSWLRWMD